MARESSLGLPDVEATGGREGEREGGKEGRREGGRTTVHAELVGASIEIKGVGDGCLAGEGSLDLAHVEAARGLSADGEVVAVHQGGVKEIGALLNLFIDR